MKKTPKQVDLRITTTELEFYDKVSRAIGKDIKGDTYVGSVWPGSACDFDRILQHTFAYQIRFDVYGGETFGHIYNKYFGVTLNNTDNE